MTRSDKNLWPGVMGKREEEEEEEEGGGKRING